jgi:shikimate dehydrogenase
VTVPHKAAALELADEASDDAREIGAANTLTFTDDGIRADNTDAPGLLAALPEPPSGRALVLGAGGAARAAIWALAGAGAEVHVWNRTAERAEELCEELDAEPVAEPDSGGYDLIVNATAVGLGSEDPFEELPLAEDSFAAGQVVVDLVYGEKTTTLIGAAERAGARTVDGLEILVRQGAESLRLWTDRDPPLDAMRTGARGA